MASIREPRLILVVDDNQVVAMSLEDTLRDAGFAVLTVNSGQEAVALIEQARKPVAIVTDIRLEAGIDGWQVAERARQVHPDIAVVYITGHSAHLHGICGVPDSHMLQKPFVERQILDAVAALVGGSRPTRH